MISSPSVSASYLLPGLLASTSSGPLVPLHPPPDQPLNTLPDAAAAVSVTVVPDVNDDEHVAPQLMPAGLLVTVPDPAPVFDTDSAAVVTENVAVALFAASIVSWHVA